MEIIQVGPWKKYIVYMETFEKISYYDGNFLLHFYTGNIHNLSLSVFFFPYPLI